MAIWRKRSERRWRAWKIWIGIFALLAALAAGLWIGRHMPAPARETQNVSYVYDGDTIAVQAGDAKQTRIRLLGINAPEVAHAQDGSKAQPWGDEAKEALRALLPVGTRVTLEFDERRYDQYGRTLAYVWLEDGTLINEELVRGGFAKVLFYTPNVRHKARIARVEREAQRAGLGVWSGT